MINEDSILKLSKCGFNIPNTCIPCFESYSVANIPNSVLKMFEIESDGVTLPEVAIGGYKEKPTNIILILLDAFGWNSFEKYAGQFDFIKRFESNGIISKVTSQFPSTTSVNITTINTGLPITQHGILEWFYYDARIGYNILPLLNAIVEPEFIINSATDRTGLETSSIYPESNFYKKLQNEGIETYVCNPINYKKSKINHSISAHTKWIDGNDINEQLNNLVNIINGSKNRKYTYIYEPRYDNFCHNYGFASEQASEFTKEFFAFLESFISKIKDKNTYIIFTADHGIRDCNNVLYIDKVFPEIRKYIKRDRSNNIIAPTGGPSDWFLYVNQVEEVCDILEKRLSGIAKVLNAEEAINCGFFGPKESFSPVFKNNLPDLFILSTSDTSFGWLGKEEGYTDISKLIGVHGGINKAEMESVFMMLKI